MNNNIEIELNNRLIVDFMGLKIITHYPNKTYKCRLWASMNMDVEKNL